MRLITPPLAFEKDDGFKNDILKREDFGKGLLNLVTRSTDELVISLDGEWGEGKSTFIRMWQGLLNEAGIPNIYIDAFANDYVDDAFITVASAITSYVDANTNIPHEKTVADFKDKTKKIGVQLLSWSARLGIKAATLGIISATDIEELKGIKDDLSKDPSKVVSDFIEERLTSHSKDIGLLESFKKLLSDLPKYLQKEDGKERPLVIIIDELDRCKPTYAVEVIEKIKHLFSVKNVVFVLVMNKKQLEESIRCVYGQGIDAHTYLQKFISVETSIPKRIDDPQINDIASYCSRLGDLHEFQWNDNTSQLLKHTNSLAIHFNLSLRQLEKVFTNIAIFYASIPENRHPIPQIVSFVCVIKAINTPLFNDLLHSKVSYAQLCTRINLFDESNPAKERFSFSSLLTCIKWAVLTDTEYRELNEKEQQELAHYKDLLFWLNIERNSVIPNYCQRLNMFSIS